VFKMVHQADSSPADASPPLPRLDVIVVDGLMLSKRMSKIFRYKEMDLDMYDKLTALLSAHKKAEHVTTTLKHRTNELKAELAEVNALVKSPCRARRFARRATMTTTKTTTTTTTTKARNGCASYHSELQKLIQAPQTYIQRNVYVVCFARPRKTNHSRLYAK
jgi:hypothetical protein